MNKLFEKEDVFTCTTADKAALGTPGYFGDTLPDLVKAIAQRAVTELTGVDQSDAYCFKTNNDRNQYILFLPVGRVKKTYTYRPFANIDELLDFLVPDLDVNDVCDREGNNDEIIRYKKAELLLGKKITLREKQGAYTNVVIIQSVDFYGNSDASEDIHINNNPVNFMFEGYKILIDGEFVPFGVKE